MKRSTILLIILFLILIFVIGVFFILGQRGGTPDDRTNELSPSAGGFFPFGTTDTNDISTRDNTDITDRFVSEIQTRNNLIKIVGLRTAGYLSTTTENGEMLRYIRQDDGNIFEINLDQGVEQRLTNTTIPSIQEVIWHKDGENMILRYIDSNNILQSYKAAIVSTSSDEFGSLDGVFMEENIPFFAQNNDRSSFSFLRYERIGSTVVEGSYANDSTTDSFDSTFRDWLLQVLDTNQTILTSRPSSESLGYSYSTEGKESLSKNLGPINGLTTLYSPNGDNILFSESVENSFTLNSHDSNTFIDRELELTTLPEKCAWSSLETTVVYCGVPEILPEADYPESWYQGEMLFDDVLWKIDVESGIIERLAYPVEVFGEEVDMVNLSLSNDESLLFFTNKKDRSLWAYTLDVQTTDDESAEDVEAEEEL